MTHQGLSIERHSIRRKQTFRDFCVRLFIRLFTRSLAREGIGEKCIFGELLGACFSHKNKKKGYRCSPTFVNLKSNTMKNTHANVR